MAYQPTVWAENDLISIDRMNKLEQGLMASAESAEQQHAVLEETLTNRIDEVEANAVPITRTVNGKALSADIALTASNVGARSSSWVPTAAQVGAVPTSRTVNGKALSANITLTAADVSARPSTWTPTAADVGALPASGGTLTGDLTIKGSGNYGTKINFGDSDYVHIAEQPADDLLEIKAKKVNFVLSDTTDTKFTMNGSPFMSVLTQAEYDALTTKNATTLYLIH